MKIQLIDSRPGVMKSIVLKEWMRIALSICLLGLPVILGYFSIQIVEARNTEIAKDLPAPSLGSEFDFSGTTGIEGGENQSNQALPASHPGSETHFAATTSLQAKVALEISGGAQYSLENQHRKTIVEQQAPTMYADYGDMFTTAQMAIGFASTCISELFGGFTLHKTGRLIDPATYIHSTIR
jgi:hypothetical protein